MTTSNLAAPSATTPDLIPTQEGFPRVSGRDESGKRRLVRRGHRARLYTWAFLLVGLAIILVALIVANTGAVKLDWVIGSTHASLVWIILAAAVLGWLLGVTTNVVFRHRTR